MDKYNLLMKAMEKAQADMDAEKSANLLQQSQYTQARKNYNQPILRMDPNTGQFAQDNYANGFNLIGMDALRETPQDTLMKLLNKNK